MALIDQVLKRVREANFLRLVNGNVVDKNDAVITVTGGGGGGGGSVDVAASIVAAAGKTTPVNTDELGLVDSEAGNVLKGLTVADLKSTIQTYLLGLDFVRVNANKDLLSGSGQIVTQASTGMRYNTLLDTSLTDTTAGLFKMNNNAPAINATVIVTIDYLDKNGTDMSSYMGSWAAGGTLNMRSASAIDTSFAAIAITAVGDQNPATSFRITGTYLGGVPFVGGEAVVIQYVPPTNVGATITGAATKTTPVDADKIPLTDSAAGNILKALTWANLKANISTYLLGLGYTRVDAQGNLIDGSNSIIDGINPVYALSSAPVSGVNTLPAANTVTDGNVIALHKDCLVGAGRNPAGILLKADVTNNLWRPANDRVLLFSKRFGTYAAPTLTMTSTSQASSSKFNVGVDPVIPANLFYTGATLVIEMNFRRNTTLVGLGTVTLQCFLGTDATTQTNNSQVWQASIADSDDRDIFPAPEIVFNSATSITSTRNLSKGEGGISIACIDLTTLINSAAAMNITWRVQTTLDVNNTIDFLGYKIWMIGA